MKFIDEAKIYVKAGDGGKGCVSFRREKFVPRGGPNGGDGGKGGDVIIKASSSHRTLLDLKYQQHQTAKRGQHGEGSNKTGRSADDLVVIVPVGTLLKDADTDEVLADLTVDGQTFIAGKGGIGGRGNARFATAKNRAPRFAQEGMPGDECRLLLELKLLADEECDDRRLLLSERWPPWRLRPRSRRKLAAVGAPAWSAVWRSAHCWQGRQPPAPMPTVRTAIMVLATVTMARVTIGGPITATTVRAIIVRPIMAITAPVIATTARAIIARHMVPTGTADRSFRLAVAGYYGGWGW